MSTTSESSASTIPLTALARKAKRLRDWETLLEQERPDSGIRRTFEETLNTYRALLWSIWEHKTASPTDAQQLASLERELEKLDELVRLAAARR